MGRGRAKAKQTKVARQLKYGGPTTDLERLQAELAGAGGSHDHDADDSETENEYDDPYAKYVEDEPSDEDGDADGAPEGSVDPGDPARP